MKTYNYSIDNINYNIIVGQSCHENWKIIDDSDSFDLWIHEKDCPSAHVIIKQINNIQNIVYPNELVIHASSFIKFKNTKNKTIVYTRVENITKGKHIGSVLLSSFNTLKL